jgi:membrane-bound metal-dependent hydrolase YbcI (DUF457 family)
MQWRTHVVAGANTIWLLPASTESLFQYGPVLMIVAGFFALLPDIEAQHAKIHGVRIAGARVFDNTIVRSVVSHRGPVHSFLAVGVVGALTVWFCNAYELPYALAWAATLGYASHPIIDGFNHPGVSYLYPWKRRLHLVPKAVRFRVKSLPDELLFVSGVLGILLYGFVHIIRY